MFRNPYPAGFEEFVEDFPDPLGDHINSGSFNILNFVNSDADTPADSPADPRMMNPNRQHHVADPHHNNIYQNPTRLPDSPPITDISSSGAGSSASPASNSDPPYSPDNFGSYPNPMLGQVNHPGMILGVSDLQTGMLLHDPMPPQGHPRHQNQIHSPQSQVFISPYPPPPSQTPVSLSQVSPPSNRGSDPYMMNGYGANMFGTMIGGSSDGSLNSDQSSDHSGSVISRKRKCMDQDRYIQNMIMNGNPPSNISYDENYTQHHVCPSSNPDANEFNAFATHQQVIKFSKYDETKWHPLFDEHRNQLQELQVHVVADKGFNFSMPENCFVNQKKNHFQITCNIEALDAYKAKYVQDLKTNELHEIEVFQLKFRGVKAEMHSSDIQITQSQNDRKPMPHTPVNLEIQERRITKVTVPRLHFAVTTNNNQRKNNRPNPDQKYFILLVCLNVRTTAGLDLTVQAYQSERVIVRATNPGSFEPPEAEFNWQRGLSALYTNNPVAIGTDAPIKDAKLSVAGDIFTAGRIICPSDIRLKEHITPMDPITALDNINRLRVVNFLYKPEVAALWGLTEEQRKKTGVIAQELEKIMPDAVNTNGDYLTIDENRIFYETVMATQELCRLTGDLDSKIDEKVEEISERLARYARRKKLTASMASGLSGDPSGYDNRSLASIGSLAPFKRERRCRNNCDRNDNLCSSKVTQGTVISLVFVMALCLIAMSTLYVLDWHNRNYGGYPHYIPEPMIPREKQEVANIIIGRHDAIMKLPHYPPPISPQCHGDHCHSYCCSARPEPIPEPEPIKNEDIYESTKYVYRKSAESSELAMHRDRIPVQNSFSEDVIITIPSLNMTLDTQYCLKPQDGKEGERRSGSCSYRRGQYTLYIPVSPTLPTVSLEVDFKIPRNKVLNSCSYLNEILLSDCSGQYKDKNEVVQGVAPKKLDQRTVQLPIGLFTMSGYRFRVGYTTKSCYSTGNVAEYEEFNLIFYRKCDYDAVVATDATHIIEPNEV